MAFLRATKGLDPGSVFQLKPGVNILGRNVNRCDVVLQHHAVSREHARIDVLSDGTFIEDLGSRNGVLVNGLILEPGVAGRRRLQPQDRIEIASFEFIFHNTENSDTVAIAGDQSTGSEILSFVDVSSDSSRVLLKAALGIGSPMQAGGDGASPRVESAAHVSPTEELSDHDRRFSAVMTLLEDTTGRLDPQRTPSRVLDSLFRIFPQAVSGCVLRLMPNSEPRITAVKNADGTPRVPRLSRSVLDFVALNRRAALSGESSDEPAFSLSLSARNLKVRSVMCVPLIDSSDNVAGVIEIETTVRDPFTRADLEMLAGVARHLSIVIENAELHTASLRAQQAEYEARFLNLIEGSIQGVIIHRDFEPLYVNEAWARLHGYLPEHVLEMDSVLPLFSPSERDTAVRIVGDLMAGRIKSTRRERQDLCQDGSTIWLEAFATVVNWEGGPAIQSTIIDLTDRKRAETALRESRDVLELRVKERTSELAEANERLHSLVDHIPLCVVRKKIDGTITFVNRALCQLFQRSVSDFVGKTDFDLFSREQAEAYRRADMQVMNTREQMDLVESLPTPSGELRQIHTLKTPIFDANGTLIGTQLLFWDITEQRRMEDERNRYAAELERSNRELEQFAYCVSHDLQSPLRTVASYCQMLQKQHASELSEDAREFVDNALEGARRMKRLLDDLLAYSRVTSKPRELETVEMEVVLAEALRNLASLIRDSHAVVTHDPLPSVLGDRTQLMQLLQNFVQNALQYRSSSPPRIHIGCEDLDGNWQFAVRDNGIGIDAKDFDRIFQVFQRLQAGDERSGTGIGLSICKRIVERHGGQIHVASTRDKGSTFYFTLPKQTCEQA